MDAALLDRPGNQEIQLDLFLDYASNVSAAIDPKPGFAAVAAVNAAIIALAKAFAEQGIKDGAQVNSVVPGAV